MATLTARTILAGTTRAASRAGAAGAAASGALSSVRAAAVGSVVEPAWTAVAPVATTVLVRAIHSSSSLGAGAAAAKPAGKAAAGGAAAGEKAKGAGGAASAAARAASKGYTKVELQQHQRYYDPAEDAQYTQWSPSLRRVGVVALKCGMMPDWDTWGQRHPLTVLKLENVQVVQVKTPEAEGFYAMQVGGGEAKPSSVNKPMAGHFARAGVTPKIKLAEFPVSAEAVLPVGTPVYARHFVPGQHVDVTGISIGKGFQGPMKRWGFGGLRASHGVSVSHRSHGSTGSTQDPGRVWKGKKMAGHMGVEQVTVDSLQVYKIDIKEGLIFVRGAVPGHKGGYVLIRDSIRKPPKHPVPFPTYVPTPEDLELMRQWQAGEFHSAEEAVALRSQGQKVNMGPAFELVMKPQDWDPFGIHDWEEGEA